MQFIMIKYKWLQACGHTYRTAVFSWLIQNVTCTVPIFLDKKIKFKTDFF